MRIKYTNIRTALVVMGLCLGVASAQAGYLLNEDFNDGAATYTSVGTTNIRPISNLIYRSVNTGFDSYPGLSGSFLVLGDSGGALPGGPTGSVAGQRSKAAFNLGSFNAGLHSLGIAFDWVFDTNQATLSTDDFSARLMVGSALIDEPLSFSDVGRNDPNRRGHFNEIRNFTLGTSGTVTLEFELKEFNGTAPNTSSGDSAVGIDNISVVPEPTSIALVCVGLFGLLGVRRRCAVTV